MVYDITERKRTELDLLQTKERFRMLVETSPMGLVLMVGGKVKYTNPGILDLLGMRMEDEVYDAEFASLFHEDDQAVLREDIRLVEMGERPPYREVRMMQGDTVVEVGIRMTLSFHDRSAAVQVTVSDLRTRVALVREQMRAALAEESNQLLKEEIERHKQTQTRLADAERFNRSIIESSIDMIVAFAPTACCTNTTMRSPWNLGWTWATIPNRTTSENSLPTSRRQSACEMQWFRI